MEGKIRQNRAHFTTSFIGESRATGREDINSTIPLNVNLPASPQPSSNSQEKLITQVSMYKQTSN